MAGLAFALSLGVAGAAHAQHVVTEAEASKLTLEALTAPPPPPRPIYRAYVHRAMARSFAPRETRWAARVWRHRDVGLERRETVRVSDRHAVRRSSHVTFGRQRRA